MKKLGIIGGAGPYASALLYETIVREGYLLKQRQPKIYLINYPFTRGLCPHESEINLSQIENELLECLHAFKKLEVEVGLLACNTLHLFLEKLPGIEIPFISLPKTVLQEALRQKHTRLLLLGTSNTCRSSLYHHAEITTLHPSPDGQSLVNEIIDRILAGEVLADDAEKLGQLINNAAAVTDFDGVILGCTDLPVLHHTHPIPSNKKIYDSIKISAKNIRVYL